MSINLNKETKKISGKYIYIDDAKKDYIQDISINTNIKQDSREGYNLLDILKYRKAGYSTTINGITFTVNEDGSITINGTATADADFYIVGGLTDSTTRFILKAGTYTQYNGLTNGQLILIHSGNVILNGITIKQQTLTVDKEISSIMLRINKGATYNNKKVYLMVVEGSYTESTMPPYEQYGSMPSIEFPSEIKTPVGKQSVVVENKNLFSLDKAILKHGSSLGVTYEDKKITMITAGGTWSNAYVMFKNPKKNSYIFTSADFLETVTASKKGVSIYGNNSPTLEGLTSLISVMQDVSLNTKKRIGAGADTGNYEYIMIRSWDNATATSLTTKTNCVVDNIQMEFEGMTAYTPHQSQVQDLDLNEELLGTIVDKEDGSYFENRYLRIILNENTQPTYFVEQGDYTLFQYNTDNVLTNVYCDKLKFKGNWGTNYNYESIYRGGSTLKNIQVKILSSRLTEISTNGIQQWLAKNNLNCLCELATPTYTKLTDEQQAQWNAIKKMHTYEGVTNLYTINDNGISPVINLEYTTKYAEEYDFYIDENARFIVPEYGINYQVSMTESDLSDMPEASESAVKIAGKDGDVVLNTTYEPKDFNIVAYTDDNLEPKDKEAEKTKLVNFLHSIKNRTKNFGLLYREKFYPVKYNDKLTPTIYPKSIRFEIPIKSSKSLGYALEKKMIFGNGKEISNTIEETGCKIIIEGPIYGTNDSPMVITLNDYQMAYYNTVLEGNRLEIDTNNSTIKHISSNGEVTNVAAYYNHEYPKIKYGENEIKILSKIDSETQVYTEWYDLKI